MWDKHSLSFLTTTINAQFSASGSPNNFPNVVNDLQLAVAQLLQAPSFDSQLHYNKKRIVGNIISGNAYKGYDIALIQQTQFWEVTWVQYDDSMVLGITYLDHAGTTLFPESQIKAFYQDLTRNVYGK